MSNNDYYTINKGTYTLLKNLITGKRIYIIKEDNKSECELKQIIESINTSIFSDIKDKKNLILIRKIISNIDKIIQIFFAFNKKYNDKSLNKLYKTTEEEFTKSKWKIQSYNTIRTFLEKSDKDEYDLLRFCNLLKNEDIINQYYKYRKFSNNKKIANISREIDLNDINLIINKLLGVLNNQYAFQPPIFMNKYTKDFINAKLNINRCTKNEILDLAVKVNDKYNSNLLAINNKYKGSILYYYYKIRNYKRSKANKEMYYKNKDIIFNQYKENINNLKLYLNSFKFINIALDESVMNELEENLLDEDNLFNCISRIRDSLVIYREFLILKESIDKLDNNIISLLDIFYNITASKRELNLLIKFIPLYYSYTAIDLIEKKESRNILSYQNINKYFEEITIALTTLKSIKKQSNINDNINIIDNYEEKDLKDNENNVIYINQKEIVGTYNDYTDIDINGSNDDYDYILTSVNKVVVSWGYNTKIIDDTLLMVLINNDKHLYISFSNTIDIYRKINSIISLFLEKEEVIFIWDRDWWLDKANEINRVKFKIENM